MEIASPHRNPDTSAAARAAPRSTCPTVSTARCRRDRRRAALSSEAVAAGADGPGRANPAAAAAVRTVVVGRHARAAGTLDHPGRAGRLAQVQHAHLAARARALVRAAGRAAPAAAHLPARAHGEAVAAVSVVRQDAAPAAVDLAPGALAHAGCVGRPAATGETGRVSPSRRPARSRRSTLARRSAPSRGSRAVAGTRGSGGPRAAASRAARATADGPCAGATPS